MKTILTTRHASTIEVSQGPWPDLVHVEVESVITGTDDARRGSVARVMLNLNHDEARRLAAALRSFAP